MMDIVSSRGFCDPGARCRAFDSTPGKGNLIIDVSNIVPGRVLSKITYRVPCASRVLVDGCERLKFKLLDPASTFLLPADSHELDEVEPVLRELRARNIIVVEPVKPPDKAAVKNELYHTISYRDGSLINKRFAASGLLPGDMEGADFSFIGDATDDSVKCYKDPSHVLSDWTHDAEHIKTHHNSHHCQCFEQPEYCLPYLLDVTGTNVTGQTYRLIDKVSNSVSCHRGIVLIHRDHPVRTLTLKTLDLDIDALCLDKLEKSLQEKEENGLINDEYFALRERFLRVSHFSGLLRRFRWLREEYIALLNSYTAKLQTEQQVVVAEKTVASLLACPVKEEIKNVVSALTGLEKARWQEGKQKLAGSRVHQNMKAGINNHAFCDSQGRKSAEVMLAELAEVYAVNHFRDAVLNDLMTTGSLGCLCSDDYFKSEMRDEILVRLWEKGTDLTGVLASIADNLRDLTEPFLEREKSSKQRKDLTERCGSCNDL